MGHTTTQKHRLTCDVPGCTEKTADKDNEVDMVSAAEEAGWTVTQRGGDYFAVCDKSHPARKANPAQ